MKTLAKVGATSKLLVVGPQWCRSTICLQQMRHNGAREPIYRHDSVTPVAGSIFRPLSQTHISKREFKNGHISRFCSVFQVIQVISSAKFFSAEELDLSFNSETKEHLQILNASFWNRDRENVFYKCSNSGRNESSPQTQNNVSWISSKADLKMSFLNWRLEMWVWKSGPKIDPATCIRQPFFASSSPFTVSENRRVLERKLFFWRQKNGDFEPRSCDLILPY